MFKELITKVFTVILVLGALHATAGGINPEKVEGEDVKKTIVVESDSTKDTSDDSSAALDKLSDKATDKSSISNSDDDISSTESSTSIVSFNFVYYLLEKFKFSDLLGR